MEHTVVVSSNCQTGGLSAALSAMLPSHEVEPLPWFDEVTPVLAERLAQAETWVTSAPARAIDDVLVGSPGLRVLRIPLVIFDAFHPDLAYAPNPGGGFLKSPADDYNSVIVLWGWKHDLAIEQIVARFSPETCVALGYTRRWNEATRQLRALFEPSDLDFQSFFLRMRRRSPFMLTANHPRVDALIEMARQVAARLGAPEDLLQFPWETVLPDGLLVTGPVWPIYPAVAETLCVAGGLVWRRSDGGLLDLGEFVAESLAGYSMFDPDEIEVPHLNNPVYDAVLPVEPAGQR
jgi:hypothetical protein